MALKIRLRQQGRANRQTYRLVVTDVRCPRDGKYLEMLGWYNPFAAEHNCQVHGDRISYWLGLGAQITASAEALIAKIAPDVIKELKKKRLDQQMKKIVKRRASKKTADAKKAPAVSAKAAEKAPKAAEKPKAVRAKKAKPKE